jgi:hypothetical protein
LVPFRTLRPSSADAHGVAGKELAVAVDQGNAPAVALEWSRSPRFPIRAFAAARIEAPEPGVRASPSTSFRMSILEGAKTSTNHLAWPRPEGGSPPPDPIGHIGSMDPANWLIYRTPGDGDECANGLDAEAHVCGRGRRSSAITSRAQDRAFARACRPNSSCRFICSLSANDQNRIQIASRVSRCLSGVHCLQRPQARRIRHAGPRHISRTIGVGRTASW